MARKKEHSSFFLKDKEKYSTLMSSSAAVSHVSKVRALYLRALNFAKSWTPDRGAFREKVSRMYVHFVLQRET